MPIVNRTDDNEVMRRAMTIPELRAIFLQTLEACARSAAANNWLADVFSRLASLINGAAREDNRKPFTNDQFAADLEHLRRFIAVRSQFVREQVAALRSNSAEAP